MVDRKTKLRWRRRIVESRRQVEDIGVQTEQELEKHLFRRLDHLPNVRRFVIAWILLLVLLIGGVIYQTRMLDSTFLKEQPAPGGTYNEGIIGSFTNANPLYATSDVDSSVAHLVFSGLLKYNQKNQLVGDLANNWQVDDQGITYTFHLKPNLIWQDDQPLTSADVVFTYQTIQNPDAQSPLFNSFEHIKVSAPNPTTVIFNLPSALTSFPYSLTTGLIPKHLLDGVPVSQLRSVAFNTSGPIGSGAFKWQGVDVEGQTPESRIQHIGLVSNGHYVNGQPKLNGLIINTYHDEKGLLTSFRNGQLNGAAGLASVPEELNNQANTNVHSIPLSGEVLVFFKTSSSILTDPKVRQALVRATNTGKIIDGLGYPVITANEPLLKNQVGYNKDLVQLSPNITVANQLLDQAGWKVGSDGIRTKNNQKLTFKLYSQSNSEYAYVTEVLQQQWRAVGVDAQVFLQHQDSLQTTISFHSYDALVYGITIGVDPDVFAYWHSSQADIRSASRLNFSEYRSPAADLALEAGRSRVDPAIRAIKYRGFLTAWRDDAPAIALYQPRFLYLTRGQLFNFNPKILNISAERFDNVGDWEINQVKNNK